jgi:GTPase SAR1 family protein
VGKTSFIRNLLGRDFKNQRIGPEPTTDKFTALLHAPNEEQEGVILGNALSVQANMPFRGLSHFGDGFLSKFEGVYCHADVLKNVILVDTPGVLSGAKQSQGRSFDFVSVTDWFAERADAILLMFDAHKLDISDEFRKVIEVLRGREGAVRIILNKSDQISTQELMRVYGALMWALSRVLTSPEVVRVYIGSFWDNPECGNPQLESLFKKEAQDLLTDLGDLPRTSAVRRLNGLVRRARLARVHALLVSHLRSQMPRLPIRSWREAKQIALLQDLEHIAAKVVKQNGLSEGDIPDLAKFREASQDVDFASLPRLNGDLLAKMAEMIAKEMPRLTMDPAVLKKEADNLAKARAKANAEKIRAQKDLAAVFLGLLVLVILGVFAGMYFSQSDKGKSEL